MLRNKRVWLKLTLAALGLATGLLFAEGLLRAFGIGYPLPYAPDEFCGTRLQAGVHGWWCKEGHAFFEVNRYGFRQGLREPRKPVGSFRVAVLGDSFVEAFQVPYEQSLCAVLEQELASCPSLAGRSVEVLNFGVSGYGTAQELLMLRHYVWDYEPDIVLLTFFAGNDLRNNARDLEPYQVRPFLCRANGAWVFDNSFREHPDYLRAGSAGVQWKVGLINRVRVLQLANEWLGRWRQPASEPPPAGQVGAGLNELALLPPRDAAWSEAWEVTEQLLGMCQREARDHDARLFLVTLGQDLQVHPDQAVRVACQRHLQVSDLGYAERRLKQFGQEHGFPVIDLSQPMRQSAEEHGVFLHGFDKAAPGWGHWNAAGHRLAARTIGAAVCAELPR
ncbi:MAG: SGNH/GDSL hydrolase family protein [Planctomycetota bacterium]|nr:SGNH/GDSL hydrolase family protein [Planctomycetota bacterium]